MTCPGGLSGCLQFTLQRSRTHCACTHTHTHFGKEKPTVTRQEELPRRDQGVMYVCGLFSHSPGSPFRVRWSNSANLAPPSQRTCREKVVREAPRPLKTEQKWAGAGGPGRDAPAWWRVSGSSFCVPGLASTCARGLREGEERDGEGRLCLLVWGPRAVPPLRRLQSLQQASQAPFRGRTLFSSRRRHGPEGGTRLP